MTASAKQSFGLEIKLRTATGLDAVKATRSLGASNSKIVFTAKTAGAQGNNIRVSIINPGANGDETVVVTGNDIVITAGYSSSAIDSRVNDIIAAVYANPDAAALVDVSNDTGDGTGLVGAAALSALTGGTDATHTFLTIEGVDDIDIPGQNREALEYTSHSSAQARAEYLKSKVKDGQNITLPIKKWDPSDAVHAALKAAEDSDDAVRMQFIFPESLGGFEQDVLVLDVAESYKVKGILMANIKCLLSGARTEL